MGVRERRILLSMLLAAIVVVSGCTHSRKISGSRPDRSLHLSPCLWSPSGDWMVIDQSGLDSPERLVSVHVASREAPVLAVCDETSFLESWACASHGTELCYIMTSARGRVLQVCDTEGSMLRKVDLPREFRSTGLEWTRDGRVVAVDVSDRIDMTAKRASGPSLIRVFSEDLKHRQEFEFQSPIYDIQLHPKLAQCILAIAGGNYNYNVVSIDLTTRRIQQITNFGGVSYGPGHWKYVEPDSLYFIARKSGEARSQGLYRYDGRTRKVEVLVDGAKLMGGVSGFDISGSEAVFTVRGQLYRTDLTNRHISQLTQSAKCYRPSFSPNGRKLAVIRNLRELVVRDLKTAEESVVYVAR